MEANDTALALLTQMGIVMEDLSADCICAGGASSEEIDALLQRCSSAIEEMTLLLADARKVQHES